VKVTNLFLLLAGIGLSSGRAALLAYEGFDYPAGGLTAMNGGSGWNGGWQTVNNGSGIVVAGNLLAGGNAPNSFDARSAGNLALINNNTRSGRWLDCSPGGPFGLNGYVSNGRIGADGTTLYLSFLQQPGSTLKFYEFELHRADLGDPGRIGGIGNDFNSTTVNFRAPNTVQTPMGWGSTNVSFYVLRIDFKAGNDDVYVYRNPTGNTEADNEPVLTMLAVADMSFDGISLAAFDNGLTVKHDEIRLGQTWNDVLGGPPLFVVQPTDQTLYAGQPATLTSLGQSSQPLSYQWYFGTNALTGETNVTLSVASAQLSDAGKYLVTASNALGIAVSSNATLTILPIVVAITSPQTSTIGTGSNLVINASVSGAPPVSLQWYRDGVAIAGATDSTYSLNTASAFDAGVYALVASNTYGSVTSSIVSVVSGLGGLLAYEGFDYGMPSSDIGGSSGGFGWANAWVNLGGGSSQTLSNSLVAGSNSPAGFDAHSADGALFIPNASRKGRYLDCTPTGTFGLHGYLDGGGNIGADGKTLYLSFLQQPDGTSLFYEFELHRNDLGDGGRMGGIGNDTGDTQVHLRIETPPGGASTQFDLGAGNTNVNFYVVRIDFKTGNDDVFVYRNPTSTTEPATATLTISNAADMSFDGISLAAYVNGRTVTHDELRLGMTWADVMGATLSQLQLVQCSNNSSQLRLAGSPNFTFGLQAAANLTGPWSDVGSVSVSSLGVGRFAETNTNAQRFYRATNSSVWFAPPSGDVVFADFEQPTYGAWLTTGSAFGSGPALGTLPNQQTVSGYVGARLINSFLGGDAATGTLTSPAFVITKPFINFLIGGGDIPGQECMNLLISNVVVKTATGGNSEALAPQQWNVSAYLGQTGMIQIVDAATGGWGHINVDQITFSDTALPALSREMIITNHLLNLPVQNSAAMRRVTVTVGGQPVRDFNIRLSTGGPPDWWAFVDVSEFTNQTATLSVSSLTSTNDGFYAVLQTNGIVDGTNLYQEALRPQLHFTTKRGWLNDANAMFYHSGKYHLYYQHDPFDWGGRGQKWWGHAVSADMVNWMELQEGLYSHAYGDQVYSGSAIVDTANTGGFKTGTNDVIVAAFTSTARGECIDYSNDGGLTFTEITNNPVVVHNGRDPHLLWYAPSNYWVMAVYDETGGGGISFYSSPDFRQWTYRSKINGYFECPDIFQLPVDGDTNNLMWLLCDASGGYQLGQFDGVTFAPSTSKLPGNSGSAFYASQTFTSMAPGDQRLVRIGWAIIATPGMPFNQMMYFPTVLTLQTTASGVRLCHTPVAEITNNAVAVYDWANLGLSPGYNPLSGIRGTLFDLKAQFAAGTAQTINFTFQGVTVSYNAATQEISCNGTTNPLAPIGGSVQLEIIVDSDTVEIFGNNGQLYMPMPVSNASGNSLISLTCTGGTATFNALTVSKLKSIWLQP